MNNKFIDDDLAGRIIFLEMFQKCFKKLIQGDQYESFDMSGLTKGNIDEIIEIKKRELDIHKFSGNTMMEKLKFLKLYQLWLLNPEKHYVYFNIYQNNYTIAFNLNHRFKLYELSAIQWINWNLPITTSINTGNKTKVVTLLCFNPEKDFKNI